MMRYVMLFILIVKIWSVEVMADTQLSKNFYLSEFVSTSYEKPELGELLNIIVLTHKVLQPIRHALGPIKITSGYRPEKLNKKVGGKHNSQHIIGEAVDIFARKKSLRVLYNYIKNNLEYDQLILEPTWVHVSFKRRGNNRKEHLLMNKRLHMVGSR